MKKTIKRHLRLLIISLAIVLSFYSFSSAALRQEGSFEIYVFKVGQGDSQFIVSPSGKTMLIDVAEMNWNSSKGADLVAQKIKDIMGEDFQRIDYIVATHLHLDHIGTAGKGGIWALIEKHGFAVGKLIDRDSGVWKDKNKDGVCDNNEIVWHNVGTLLNDNGKMSSTMKEWICYVTSTENASKLNREIAEIGSTTQIDLGPDMMVSVIQRDAVGVKMKNSNKNVSGNHIEDEYPPSENDYSITLKITYKDINYVTGGDTDGEYARSSFGYEYNDVESVIAPKIGKVQILHVNHHGSAHSSNQKYIDTLNPIISLISCGYKNRYDHPDQTTLNSLIDKSTVYLTDECNPGRDYKTSKLIKGDIIIRSKDGVKFSVNNDQYSVNDK